MGRLVLRRAQLRPQWNVPHKGAERQIAIIVIESRKTNKNPQTDKTTAAES
jgi:hypothetical protein